jgi:CRISPR-associated protein Cmr6
MSLRRAALTQIRYNEFRETANAGLWLQKYLDSSGEDDKDAKRRLVQEVATLPEPKAYETFYNQWCEALRKQGARTRIASVSGRMIVGLGDESVLETSVTLHRTYGVPFIPGSALKGLAAGYSRQQLAESDWNMSSDYYRTMFGDTEDSGYLTFFDAFYIPKSGFKGHALYADVLTVHHQQYYQDASAPPADWDSPVPVPFLSATGKYLIALDAPQGCEMWLAAAFQILEAALLEAGIGAKTSSGYGRLKLDPLPIDLDKQRADELIREIEKFPLNKVAGEIGQLVARWRNLQVAAPHKRRVAEAILKKNRDAGRDKSTRERSWYRELSASIEQAE